MDGEIPQDPPAANPDDPHRALVDRIERERLDFLKSAEALRAPMQRIDQVQQAIVVTMRHLPLIAVGGTLAVGALLLSGRLRLPPFRTLLAVTAQGLSLWRAYQATAKSHSAPVRRPPPSA